MANIKLGNDTLTGVDTIKVTNADDETQKINYRVEIVSMFDVSGTEFQFTVGETWQDIANRDNHFEITNNIVYYDRSGMGMKQRLLYPGGIAQAIGTEYIANISYETGK